MYPWFVDAFARSLETTGVRNERERERERERARDRGRSPKLHSNSLKEGGNEGRGGKGGRKLKFRAA